MSKTKFYLTGLAITSVLLLTACANSANTNVKIIDLTSNTNTSSLNSNISTLNSNLNASNTNTVNANSSTNINASPSSVTIDIQASDFSVQSVRVKVGAVITWKNLSGTTVVVASDPHPTHTDLPDLNSGNLANGQSYSYTFNKLGTWGYHNHLQPSEKGIVIVE